MVSSQVIKETQEAFKIDVQVEKIPNAIPVVEVGLKSTKCAQILRGATATNTASTTLYTTPTTQDFFLTFASLTGKFVATALSATEVTIQVVIDGQSQKLIGISNFVNTNTTPPAPIFQAGNHPIKVDRGTAIVLIMDAATAGDKAFASINGYLDEVA